MMMENSQESQGRPLGLMLAVALVVACCLFAIAGGAGWFFLAQETPCGTGDSNGLDALRARSYVLPNVFPELLWKSSYSVNPYRIHVTWISDDLQAVAYEEYLIYNCGLKEADVDAYYSDENFEQVIFV